MVSSSGTFDLPSNHCLTSASEILPKESCSHSLPGTLRTQLPHSDGNEPFLRGPGYERLQLLNHRLLVAPICILPAHNHVAIGAAVSRFRRKFPDGNHPLTFSRLDRHRRCLRSNAVSIEPSSSFHSDFFWIEPAIFLTGEWLLATSECFLADAHRPA